MMRCIRRCSAALGSALFTLSFYADVSVAQVDPDTAAAEFGQMPAVWGMRLSPDGKKVSFIRQHPKDFPVAMVIDLETGKGNLFLASDVDKEMYIQWCDWANDSRLLCGFYGIWRMRGDLFTSTRLVAVNADGSQNKVLAQRQQRENWAFHQAEIVDWLPDEPKFIYMEFDEGRGEGVVRVDIYRNKLKTIERARETVWGYWSDGHGALRVRENHDRKHLDYQYRIEGEKKWRQLHRKNPEDLNDYYYPVGFGEDPSKLLVVDSHEGRRALFAETLGETVERELLYAHPDVDIGGLVTLGSRHRLAGVQYHTDKPHIEYFDEAVRAVHERIAEQLPTGAVLSFAGETPDQRFYLVHAGSDLDPGAYYRFDSETGSLDKITPTHPALANLQLASMKPISYAADDGTKIPGYLTLPNTGAAGPYPLIVFPHGGPRARDDWGFAWLPQFFAAQGYAVLQANYRGSGGYGDAWSGNGAYRDWKRAMDDIDSGVQSLIDQGIVDRDRMCVVGWSYGGYAALMSAIEFPERYRCAVSVAGVTDPYDLFSSARGYARQFRRSQMPSEPAAVRAASPRRRAEELGVPTLLFHGKLDVNVPIDHSQDMERALRRAGKQVELIEYEGAEHNIWMQKYRIDMLQKMGDFLDKNLVVREKSAP